MRNEILNIYVDMRSVKLRSEFEIDYCIPADEPSRIKALKI